MKRENRLIIAAAAAAFCIITAVILSAWSVSGAEGTDGTRTKLYVCDSVWSSGEQYPPEDIFGVCYIPLSMFGELEGVAIKENSYLNNIMISRGDKYITFDLNNNKMYTQDGAENTVATYLIYVGQRYVPAHIVCICLGLSIETRDGAVRISDGSEKLSFDALLEKANPSSESAEKTETPKAPESTAPIKPTADNTPRTAAFTFAAGEHTGEILDILNASGVKAAFFVTADYIENNYGMLRELIASGMEIGIMADFRGNAEQLYIDIEKTNNLLYDLTKKNTRIYTSDNSGLKLLRKAGEVIGKLAENGYALADINNNMVYLPRTKTGIMEYHAETFISENRITVFRFPDDENTLNTLPLLMKYISSKSNITVRAVSEGFLLNG